MNFYLQRFGIHPEWISQDPAPGLFMVVVIPCYNETGLTDCLRSLAQCTETIFPVEVIVVVNHSVTAANSVKAASRAALESGKNFAVMNNSAKLSFHFIEMEFPPRDAGVGLARKTGMDEAVRRFERAGTRNGIILCYDADCSCEKNYLAETERHFHENKKAAGASLYFMHPYENLPAEQAEAIIQYEIFLRYYVNGLRFAGHPFAFHTIGSSMAVRNEIYQKQGGMNKRKAGEDFYFLQKIFLLGNFTEINSTCVYPSARESDRVPFGTGRAIGDYSKEKKILFYDPEIFFALKRFLDFVGAKGYRPDGEMLIRSFEGHLRDCLRSLRFEENLARINSNVGSFSQFNSQFFAWFDGFQCLKFVHWFSDHVLPRKSLNEIDLSFIDKRLNGSGSGKILDFLREIDRGRRP